MGIKQLLNKIISDYRDNKKKKDELNKIKQDAYFEEMKRQSKIMGEKQAKIEAEMREKKFRHKQEMMFEKAKMNGNQSNNKIDYFKLENAFPEKIKII